MENENRINSIYSILESEIKKAKNKGVKLQPGEYLRYAGRDKIATCCAVGSILVNHEWDNYLEFGFICKFLKISLKEMQNITRGFDGDSPLDEGLPAFYEIGSKLRSYIDLE